MVRRESLNVPQENVPSTLGLAHGSIAGHGTHTDTDQPGDRPQRLADRPSQSVTECHGFSRSSRDVSDRPNRQ
jgi:hypothetical protein